MPQSLVRIYVHIVFSTKHRTPFLKDEEFRERTHRYLAGICKNLHAPAPVVGGIEDHVHILCRLGKTIAIADLIRDVKRDSSKWVKAEQPQLAEFQWQQGYGAFSISPSHVDGLKVYIANQVRYPGCAARPWALLFYAFGISTTSRPSTAESFHL